MRYDKSMNTCFPFHHRADGRVLVFQYSKSNFSVQDEKRLEEGVKSIAAEHTVLPNDCSQFSLS